MQHFWLSGVVLSYTAHVVWMLYYPPVPLTQYTSIQQLQVHLHSSSVTVIKSHRYQRSRSKPHPCCYCLCFFPPSWALTQLTHIRQTPLFIKQFEASGVQFRDMNESLIVYGLSCCKEDATQLCSAVSRFKLIIWRSTSMAPLLVRVRL